MIEMAYSIREDNYANIDLFHRDIALPAYEPALLMPEAVIWSPVALTLAHTMPYESGNRRNSPCADCHLNISSVTRKALCI